MEEPMFRVNVFIDTILCLILGSNIGLAQGLYLTANAGYGLGAGTQYLGQNSTATGMTNSVEGVFGSFGEGFKFGASAGYMFNKNLGTELSLSYWLGKTFEFTSKYPTASSTYKWSGSGFVGVPSIVLSANMETINPYARLGLVLGIVKVKHDKKAEETGLIVQYTQEETGNLAFGYVGALGIVVPAGGIVDFFTEVALHSVTFSPSQNEVTKYTVNGVDRLASLTPRVFEYKDSYNTRETYTTVGVRRPFSSIGIVVGARINL
jgi:hypothetical protein